MRNAERQRRMNEAMVKHRLPLIVAVHMALIPVGYFMAYLLRFDFRVTGPYLSLYLGTVPALVVLRMAAFLLFGAHRGWWRHAGLDDLIAIVKAITLSSLLFVQAIYLFDALPDVPRSVLVLDWIMGIVLFGGLRFAVRTVREGRLVPRHPRGATPALVVGAGEAADRLIRTFRRTDDLKVAPIGLVDDDPAKRSMSIHGVPVLGTTAELGPIVQRTGAKLVVIAVPSASREDMRRMVEACMATGVEFKIVPSLREVLDGRAKLSQLRKVEIDDLLGRDPVQLEMERVRDDLSGRTVMVTGGAGSIGSELARQVAASSPGELILLDQAESPLYFIQLEISRTHPGLHVRAVVADITDASRVDRVFAETRPDYVFHAAAYKHVPLMEENPVEAVRNNVLGTLRVAEAAARVGAEKFVLVSTDKAVHPSSVMGATKRIAERIVLGWPSLRRASTDFRAVRFGNVLGSDGSVVPLFRRQLAAGGPLTVTHRDVTRYFMTIPEAVQLVLQAAALPQAAGRISMLEMGEPVRIVSLAENLVRLSGLEPYTDVPIVFTGLRPGEKLHEELMSDVEATVPTGVEKVRVVQTDEADGAAVQQGLDRLLASVEMGDRRDLLGALCELVPECVPPLRDYHPRARAMQHSE
ncbi:MAG: polysaccharide biosynthesis protein [Gemmatimonadetes bacterium]|nr:polysaccharide biosynthesis protein [Gemmatimonadota bacterium]